MSLILPKRLYGITAVVEFFSCHEVLQVLVVRPDLDQVPVIGIKGNLILRQG